MFDGGFHHVGIACQSFEAESGGLAILGYRRDGPDFTDPIQGIRGRFLVGLGPKLELVSPIAPGGVLQGWLDRGVKMYHLAFEVPDVKAELDRLRRARARVVAGPVPAVAFGNRDIAFCMLPNLLLVELIQMAP